MKRIQVATITLVLLLLVQSVAMAASRYSPGPSTVSDGWGTWFSVQHLIDYTWQGSSGPYTNYQSLRIDVYNQGDSVTCGYALVERAGAFQETWIDSSWPFPRTYSNTPYWWYVNYYQTHGFVNGQFVRYMMKTGYLPYDGYPGGWCNSDYVGSLAGWSSALSSSQQWSHTLLNGY